MDTGQDRAEGARPARARLPVAALVLWALFAFLIPRLVEPLNVADVLAFPLGYFMAAQGSLIAFLLIAILSARRQNRLETRSPEDA